MATSLQFLHQNLYELKFSKLQDNEKFKALYDEAKIYEKHANLTSLISRKKNDKLMKETNFYLILTKMLAELKEYENQDTNFSSKLDKVYRWYIINKRATPKEKQQLLKEKPPSTLNKSAGQSHSNTPLHPNDKNLLSYRTDIDESKVEENIKKSASPLKFPDVNKSRPVSTKMRPISNLSIQKLKESQYLNLKLDEVNNSGKLPELVQKPLPTPNSYKLSPNGSSSRISEAYGNFKALDADTEIKIESTKRMSEQNRAGILKALSQYANKLYTSLDNGYTKKLENHLNSLSKFYHALDEDKAKQVNGYYDMTTFFTVKDKTENMLTVNGLVDMAKEVSDKMILSKAETMIRQNEYKLTMEKTGTQTPVSNKESMVDEQNANEVIDKLILNSQEKNEVQVPVYAIVINNQKRPKSTPFLDWRGHISRPGTVNTRSSSFKLIPSHKSRSKSTPQILDGNTDTDFSDIEIEDDLNKEYEEYIKEKTKPLRKKLSKIKQQSKSIEMPITDNNKEVKFMNFIKKIEEDNGTQSYRRINSTKTLTESDDGKGPRILSTIKSQTEKLSRNSGSSIKKSRVSTTEPPVRPESVAESMSTAINYDQAQTKKDESESIRKENAEATPITTPSALETADRHSSIGQQSLARLEDDTEREIKQIEMYQCLHDEIVMCECCMNKKPQNEHPTTPLTPTNEIFHLTAGEDHDEDELRELQVERIRKQRSIDFEEDERDLIQKHDLREILLNNFDPKFAAKIGINDFVPIEVMNGQNEAKPLEFIPFENIDKNYPKHKGKTVYDPQFNSQPKHLYRTNPSIPRPESKYGTRHSVYEQILALKQQTLQSDELAVYEPEDVLLVKDLLQLEGRHLNEVLEVYPLRVDEEMNLEEKKVCTTNVNMTPMGRPVNVHPQIRWKQLEALNNEDDKESHENYFSAVEEKEKEINKEHFNEVSRYSFIPKEASEAESISTQKKNVQYRMQQNRLDSGRPISHVLNIEDPQKAQEALNIFNEAKKSVHIPTLFKGSMIHNYVKELNLAERQKREEERKAAVLIQKNYRRHIKNRKNIERSNPMTPEALNWIRNQKLELKKRKQEKENILRIQEQMLIKENLKLRNTLKHIGMHSDLFEILYHKGPEYTNGVLNEAATCIQRWVKGWLIRKEFNKLKCMIIADGLSWSSFIKHYRKTFKRILIMRGDHKTQFDFKTHEAVEFYRREKKYLSYYQKLCFVDQIDHSDLEKILHYNDLYPTSSELKEAKDQVLKYYKKKTATNTFPKHIAFDIIYYIYPPAATKLKSTRKSTWLNPVVGQEDALRLRGFKFVEETNYENSWQLVAQSTLDTFSGLNKNTPEALEVIMNLNDNN